MKKVVGYAIAIIGLILLVVGLGYLSLDKISNPLSNSSNYTNATIGSSELKESVSKVPQYIFTIVGAGLILVGVLLLYRNPKKTKKHQEVPIYSGNQVIGYRRQ